jgi:RsiW-degrading membrane proteinase PrsW (M82 family)
LLLFLAAVFLGIVPMLIYPVFLYWLDRYEKEPFWLIAITFMWGFIPAAILSLISQIALGLPIQMLDSSGQLSDITGSIVFAPVTEEVFKGVAVLAVYLIWKGEFDGVFDGIIYGSIVGFGFAAIENILYFTSYGLDLFWSRAILFGLNHAMFTSFTGIGLGISRHERNLWLRLMAPLGGLTMAIFAHALHNTIVTFSGTFPLLFCVAFLADLGGVIFVFFIMLFALRREQRWLIEFLQDEITLGTLTKKQYDIVCSTFKRIIAGLNTLLAGDFSRWRAQNRGISLLTELAYKKYAYSQRGTEGSKLESITALRTQAAQIRPQWDNSNPVNS